MAIKNITSSEKLGGWKSVQIATLDEIRNCPNILTNNNAHNLEVFGSENTIDILPIPGSIVINAKPTRTKSGVYYSINIQVDFPVQETTIDDYFSDILQKKFIAIGTTLSGSERIFGSKNHPLQFMYEYTNGKKIDDSEITRVKIFGKTIQKPVFISN